MNTKQVRDEAVAKFLGTMIYHACKYSNKDKTSRNGGLTEPSHKDRLVFIRRIAKLAQTHSERLLARQDVEVLIKAITTVGEKYGHVFSNGCVTGTWGSRIGDLNDLLKIMDVPDFELHLTGKKIDFWGEIAEIYGYYPQERWLAVKLKLANGSILDDCIYYKDLSNSVYRKE